MHTLRDFEIDVIRLLANSALNKNQLDGLSSFTGSAEYEYTGSGYFLTVRMPMLPNIQCTLSRPFVVGEADGIVCGFVVFSNTASLRSNVTRGARSMCLPIFESAMSSRAYVRLTTLI
ncbi:MAG TPA: hypothetical protein DEP03_13000 [Massilia sp.]|jgi:hypothetical protein|nr:hypothetical protein [Massilia sp.]